MAPSVFRLAKSPGQIGLNTVAVIGVQQANYLSQMAA